MAKIPLKQAAEELGFNYKGIWTLYSQGKLQRTERLSRLVLIDKDDLKQQLEEIGYKPRKKT